jgi:lipopolysaccharide transport system ATP-binding protein
MGGDVVIRVENLGKRYTLGAGSNERYTALRDVIAQGARRVFGGGRGARSGSDESPQEFWALKDVSFEVKRGEAVGIIGRNGAGKSTLLKILSRITEPTTGRISLKGRVASLLEVGTGFHPELTGRENIYLNGAILGMHRAEIKAKFDEIVAFAEVERFLDTPVKRYSSGMYVRLAFAVAAHLEPEIFVVDEVLAVGDAQFQKKCLGKMQDVAQGGRTVLFVSHNLAVLRGLCEVACWLDHGRLRGFGGAIEITDQYLQESVKQSESETDTSQVRRLGGFGEKLRITRIKWTTNIPLVHDSPFGIEVHYTALADVDDLTLGLGFASLDGARLLTYESDLYGSRISVQKGQSGSASFNADHLPLAPGFYAIDVGARSGDLFGVDYLPGVSQLEVLPCRQTPGNLMVAGAGVRIPSNWEWTFESDVGP